MKRPVCNSVEQALSLTTNQSTNQAIAHTADQSIILSDHKSPIKQSINQAIKQLDNIPLKFSSIQTSNRTSNQQINTAFD